MLEMNRYYWNSSVVICMLVCFFLWYQYNYCSKLHSHFFMSNFRLKILMLVKKRKRNELIHYMGIFAKGGGGGGAGVEGL